MSEVMELHGEWKEAEPTEFLPHLQVEATSAEI